MIGYLAGLLLAFLAGLLVAELRGWLPIVARFAIRVAAGRLPAPYGDRYSEEWTAEFEDFVGESDRPLSALVYALRICVRAGRVASELRSPEALPRRRRVLKRSFDLAVSFVVLLWLAPLLVLLALAIRLDSPGPVLYRQRRIGKDGRPFYITKFRTMGVASRESEPPMVPSPGLLLFGERARHSTRVGRVLRRFSLDELPQLFNVLRGK